MARVTRLELATSGVTGRRSNQLSYTPTFVSIKILLYFALSLVPFALDGRISTCLAPLCQHDVYTFFHYFVTST